MLIVTIGRVEMEGLGIRAVRAGGVRGCWLVEGGDRVVWLANGQLSSVRRSSMRFCASMMDAWSTL